MIKEASSNLLLLALVYPPPVHAGAAQAWISRGRGGTHSGAAIATQPPRKALHTAALAVSISAKPLLQLLQQAEVRIPCAASFSW